MVICIRYDVGNDLPAGIIVEANRVERYFDARGAAQCNPERITSHDLELERVFFCYTVERSAVSIGNSFGNYKDCFQKAVEVGLFRERYTDLIQLFQPLQRS